MRLLPAALGAALLLSASVLGWALSQALRDTEAPLLYVEAPERVEADAPFDLRVSANEPVRYELSYGALEAEEVSQDWTVSLLAEPGIEVVVLVAEDGAGNRERVEVPVEGVVVPAVELRLPEELAPGAPYTARLTWEPTTATVEGVQLSAGERALRTQRAMGEAYAFGAVPLDAAAGPVSVRARYVDGMGRTHRVEREVQVREDDRPVQLLELSPEVLSVSTPAARQREAEALADAFQAARADPLWQDAFELPVEGFGSSGFGLARQYGPGGNVSRHGGEDIAAPAGTPVRASNAGEVRLAESFPIRGGFVMIDHGGGVSSHYFHLSAVQVDAGDAVARGETVGEVGSTGLSTGPHLHWEMRVGEVPTDPIAWVDRRRP